MARIGYSEDEEYTGQFELWQGNCRRSLRGKKGQAALRELEAALVALPSKRLVAGEFDDGENCCAIGALARHKGIKPTADPQGEMEEVGVECGMPRPVAWKVVELNDMILDRHWAWKDEKYGSELTPEERYEAVLKWVREQLSAPTAEPRR